MDTRVPHELLLSNQAFLRRLARRLVADPAAAEDLVQETSLAALRRPPRPTGSPRAWLATVMRNLALSRSRGDTRRRGRERAVARPERSEDGPDLLAELEVQRRVVEAVERLDEPYRSAVVLHYLHERTASQIAEHLGVPVATVRTRLARALERLRRDLDARDEAGRPSWSVVLLAGLNDTRPSVVGAAAAAGGAIVGAKLVAAVVGVAALGLVGLRWVSQVPSDVVGAAPAPLEASPGPDSMGALSTPVPTADTREAAGRSVVLAPPSAARPPRVALDLALGGFDDGEVGLAHVAVHFGGAEQPAFQFDRELSPSWTIDLDPLFEHGAKRPRSIRVTVDHPMYLPAESSVLVPDALLDADPPQGRLEAQVLLLPPKAIVSGEVQLEEEPDSVVLEAKLYALRRGQPLESPVDRVTLDASRRYRLRADHAEQHVVVACVERPDLRRESSLGKGDSLRPGSRILELPEIGQQVMELEPLVMERGESIAGRMIRTSDEDMFVSCSAARPGARQRRRLVWLEDRFENGPVAVALRDDGTFEVHGLAPIEYLLHPSPVSRASSSDPDSRYGFWSAQNAEVRALAPAQDVVLEYHVVEFVLEVYGDGVLLPYAHVRFQLDAAPGSDGFTPAAHGTHTGPTGRLHVRCSPLHALRGEISDPRYDTKEFHLDLSELRTGSVVRLEFDGPAVAMPTMVVSYLGDLDDLNRPDGVGFTAFECSAQSQEDIDTALATEFLAERGPPWGRDGAIQLERVRWDDVAGTWTSDELRPGRYVVAAHRRMYHQGERYEILGGGFVVDLPAGETVHAAWTGKLGGHARFDIHRTDPTGPDLGSSELTDDRGEFVPVLMELVGTFKRLGHIDSIGHYAAVGPLPAGDYVLRLHLRGGADRDVPFRVFAGRTTDVRIDLSAP